MTIGPVANSHPAPVPDSPTYPIGCIIPPRLHLEATDYTLQGQRGVILTWNVTEGAPANIKYIDVFFYPEIGEQSCSSLWRRLMKPLNETLPEAVFIILPVDYRYHFTVRAEDSYGRFGPFCNPVSVNLQET